MARRDCTAHGHVTVDFDPECIACGDLISLTDRVGLHIDRPRGELESALSIASIEEWGPASTGAPPARP